MEPLASRLRPDTLDEFVGQEHLIGEGKPLRVAVLERHPFSFILWGPPGVGKTTLARIYAKSLGAKFYELSAVSAGKTDIRDIVEEKIEQQKIIFLDEIHRFNKAQQDYLLPFVENGMLILIGATTENPSFEVIPALLSRCRVFVLNGLSDDEMRRIIARTDIPIESDALDWLVSVASGDARQALSIIEATLALYKSVILSHMIQTMQSKHPRYDKHGEEHYNMISAYIKSLRAGQADAALYYLARMVESGEDSLFIARRMVIFASEDIGIAQPTALVVANAVFRACETIGYPECAINLAHGTVYLAESKKDRSAYNALSAARADVQKFGDLPVPLKMRNASTQLMRDLDYGKGYEKYTDEDLRPEKLHGRTYVRKPKKNEKLQ